MDGWGVELLKPGRDASFFSARRKKSHADCARQSEPSRWRRLGRVQHQGKRRPRWPRLLALFLSSIVAHLWSVQLRNDSQTQRSCTWLLPFSRRHPPTQCQPSRLTSRHAMQGQACWGQCVLSHRRSVRVSFLCPSLPYVRASAWEVVHVTLTQPVEGRISQQTAIRKFRLHH
jgi:hypothetical protein